MIYERRAAQEAIDQGDVIDGVVLLEVAKFDAAELDHPTVRAYRRLGVVMTQTCDLDNKKSIFANVAEVFEAQFLVDQKLFKPADIRGPIRSGRVWGWYFLPADEAMALGEMVVDLRRLHTVRIDMLGELSRAGHRRARIKPLYREHLAKHFADTFSRIGLPRPYETMQILGKAQRFNRFQSFKISRAAFRPAAAMTPPPGWAAEPQRYRPRMGVR